MGIFQPLFGVDVSYKYIERRYSDPKVKLALHNLFVLLLKEEGANGDYAGDGTGYSVSVKNHYRTNPGKYGKSLFTSSPWLIFQQACMLAAECRGS